MYEHSVLSESVTCEDILSSKATDADMTAEAARYDQDHSMSSNCTQNWTKGRHILGIHHVCIHSWTVKDIINQYLRLLIGLEQEM